MPSNNRPRSSASSYTSRARSVRNTRTFQSIERVQRSQRFTGMCHCKLKAGDLVPCPCKKVNGTCYNKEVYGALNTRGGAFWERTIGGEDKKKKDEDVEKTGDGTPGISPEFAKMLGRDTGEENDDDK
mmetsp:Transcript_6352/g.12157  ORF Transcript_6352/g.12157 Transcript_6352/m.12157 type:complete len:128 (-) Transcript_6352:86-469(-)